MLAEDDPAAAEAPGRTVRLKFKPKGPGNASEPWLLQAKSNSCVGCGSSADVAQHVRFSIVPHALRRLLPSTMKDKDSHDIVLLCTACYKTLEGAYERHRSELMQMHGIDGRDTSRFEKEAAFSQQARSAALALANHSTKLPLARRQQLEAVVAAEVGVDPSALTPDQVQEVAGRPPDRRPKADWHAPEERLMSALIAEHEASGGETLHSFVRRWRELFVATLSPRFMPPGWRTDHRCNTERDRSF